jgi:PAS domain S-box-containing protein
LADERRPRLASGPDVTETTTRPRREDRARDGEIRDLREMLDALPVTVWEAEGPSGHVTFVNRCAESLLGHPAARWLGEGFVSAIIHPDDRERATQAIAELARRAQSGEISFRAQAQDGRTLHLRLGVRAQAAAGSRPARLRGVVTDVTEERRREEEHARVLAQAENATAEADAANRAKDEFLAMLSHELRAPLGSLLIWTQLLRTGSIDEASTARALDMIERSTETLERFINDLLDISRIIAGKFSLEIRPVDLPSVIEAAVEQAQPAAASKSIRVTTTIDRTLRAAPGDAARLQQVVGNLLSNALKFTPDGGCVDVKLEAFGPRARIQVADTGVGIPKDFLPSVFERFRQADSTSSRAHRGLGLGLSIVRHLVELHGGTVAAESRGMGEGSTFTVVLPLVTEAAEERVLAAPTTGTDAWVLDAEALRGIRVLLVDDEDDARESLRVLLDRSGASVLAVGSATAALAQIEAFAPHVLLSDIAMPEQDGYCLIRKVRALSPSQGGLTPAAALTAYASRDDRRSALLAGYQEHVPKPPEPARLISLIAQLSQGGAKSQSD